MALQRIIITGSGGGISQNTKSGPPNSARFIKNLNIYDDDTSITLNPGATKVSGTTVTGLVKWIEKPTPYSLDKYFYDENGNIYKELNADGTWSLDRTVSTGSAAGQGLGSLRDYLYYATSTTLGRLGPFSGAPSYDDDFVTTLALNLDISANTTGANTYTTPTSISEASTALYSFAPSFDPLKSVVLYMVSKGTGNWTVTLHDANNTSLATVTIANASLTNSAENTFTFSTPPRILIGGTYHVHVTSTVADGTLKTATSSDLSTAYIKTYFGVLIADANYHPMMRFTNGVNGTMLVGNDHYIGEYDPFGNVWNPNKIAIEPGYTVRAFTRDSSYTVALCWKGTSIDSEEEGRAYYWDGIQPYYVDMRPITGGLPNAGTNFKNRIFTVLGSSGELNLGTDPFRKIQPVPTLNRGKKIEVLPGGIDVWRSKAVFGMGINTDDASFYQGVYEYGNQSDKPISPTSLSTETLNLGYTISTGTVQGTTLRVGAVKAYGKDLYFGWADNGTYGVDKVTKNGNAAATASWESLIIDHAIVGNQLQSVPTKLKYASKVVIKFLTLPSGVSITAKYKIDRAANWTSGTATTSSSTDPTRAEVLINKDYREIEIGFDIISTGAYCTITGIYFEFDPLTNERFDN